MVPFVGSKILVIFMYWSFCSFLLFFALFLFLFCCFSVLVCLFLVVLLLLDVHCGLRCLVCHPLWYMSPMSKMKNCLYAVNCFRLNLDSAVFVSFFGIMSLSVHRPAKRARGSQQIAHVNPMAFGMNPECRIARRWWKGLVEQAQ